MDDRRARIINNIGSFEGLATFEANAARQNALDDEVKAAIKARSTQLGRPLIAQGRGLDLSDLSPAAEKVVEAVSEYVGVMKRQGKDATRTFEQIKNRGLIGAAEAAVARAEPTQGSKTLSDVPLHWGMEAVSNRLAARLKLGNATRPAPWRRPVSFGDGSGSRGGSLRKVEASR